MIPVSYNAGWSSHRRPINPKLPPRRFGQVRIPIAGVDYSLHGLHGLWYILQATGAHRAMQAPR